jgi:hypothetical protein
MQRISRLLAVVAVALGVMVAVPSTASADTAGCVTFREADLVRRGDTRGFVGYVFDTRGVLVSADGPYWERDIWVSYRVCGGGRLVINFDNYMHFGDAMRLWNKRWHF